MTPIASSMIAPAESDIDRDLHVTSTFESNLIFSIFLLAFVIGPLFLAPLSELYGRVIVLQLANIVNIPWKLRFLNAKTDTWLVVSCIQSRLWVCFKC